MLIVDMSFVGKVQNGVVVLPPNAHLQEGDRVEVTLAAASPEAEFFLHEPAGAAPTINVLPDDLAANHDYYLHGLSKQEPRRGRWIPFKESVRELTEKETDDFAAQLQRFAAETRGLPPDLATNHNHYLHGLPKQ